MKEKYEMLLVGLFYNIWVLLIDHQKFCDAFQSTIIERWRSVGKKKLLEFMMMIS